jgi:hypothetical protein
MGIGTINPCKIPSQFIPRLDPVEAPAPPPFGFLEEDQGGALTWAVLA